MFSFLCVHFQVQANFYKHIIVLYYCSETCLYKTVTSSNVSMLFVISKFHCKLLTTNYMFVCKVAWDGLDPKSPMTRRINGVCQRETRSEKNTHTKTFKLSDKRATNVTFYELLACSSEYKLNFEPCT